MAERETPNADRQLPLGNEIFLDHLAHFVRDGAEASRAMAQAGFAPTPVSVQSNPGPTGTMVLTGTSNVTAMMTSGYIEVLFKTSESPLAREFENGLASYPGLHLIAFAVADARAASERLASAGFRVAPIVALRRPVGTESGEAEAAFTVARVMPGEMREGRVQYLTHHTEDTVWQKRWLHHPNGARQLLDVAVVVPDAGEAAARYARFLGREAMSTSLGRGVFLDRGGVQFFDPAGFARLVPGIAVPTPPFIAMYAVRVDSLIGAANLLRSGNVRFEQRDRMLFVPFPPALGAGSWVFVENASDLPWRAR